MYHSLQLGANRRFNNGFLFSVAYNWPNHPNWNGADTNPHSATIGKIQTKSSERQLQFALRYQF